MSRYRYKGRSFGGARKAPSFGEVGLGKWGSICSLGGGGTWGRGLDSWGLNARSRVRTGI